MHRNHALIHIAVATTLTCAAPFALAQVNPATEPPPASGAATTTAPFKTLQNKNQTAEPAKLPEGKTGLLGSHAVDGTVESVGKDGAVDVRTAAGLLKVSFPQASGNLKKGDPITVYLSYSVPPSASAPASASSSK
jgi:hypothetical protein